VRVVNSRNYSFSLNAMDIIIKFIDNNRVKYEPNIIIGVNGGLHGDGCEFVWGDPKSRFFSIRIYNECVEFDSTLLVNGPGSCSYISTSIEEVKKALSIIKNAWYVK